MKTNGNKMVKIIKLGRFHFTFGGLIFFLLGGLFAVLLGAAFDLSKFLFAYSILFMAHISLNYSNDYFDLEADKHGKPSQFAGGSGILVKNPELINYARWIAILSLISSLILAAIFIYVYSFPAYFFLFVLFGNFLGWFYTAPPIRMSYNGFGELATIMAGFMMPGIGYFALMGKLDLNFLIFSIPMMLYQLLFINAVEIPDIEGDIIGGKKTWVVLKGRKFGFTLIKIAGILATFSFFLISKSGLYSAYLNFNIIALFSLIPLSLAIFSFLKRTDNRNVAINLVNLNLSSLFAFGIIGNCYFAYLILN